MGFLALAILFISYQKNIDLLSFILQHMGNIGSFLSGVGTIAIFVITASGLNEWEKQLKYGRYLNMIWNGKVKIKSIEYAILDWDVHNFYRPNKDIEKELELKSEVNELMIEAKKISHEVDILGAPDCGVANSILDLQLTFKNVYDHVESYQEVFEEKDQIDFDKTRKKLREKLNKLLSSIYNNLNMLEIRYSK